MEEGGRKDKRKYIRVKHKLSYENSFKMHEKFANLQSLY